MNPNNIVHCNIVPSHRHTAPAFSWRSYCPPWGLARGFLREKGTFAAELDLLNCRPESFVKEDGEAVRL
jgi:hypothetical protein